MQLEPPQDAPRLSRGRGLLRTAGLLVLPFLLLSWLMPFRSDWTLGQDYPRFATPQQQELLFSLETGSFPLYAPGFSGGRAASALTLGQIYHPLSHLAGSAPGYWDGEALEWNTFFRLLSLGVAHVLLFRLLLRLRLGPLLALGLSTVTVYNLRMLNLFHIGAALECYTGFLAACASVLWCGLEPRRWLPRVGVIVSTYLILTGGHPQFAYYGLLGVVVVTLVAPAFLASIGHGESEPRSPFRFHARVGALVAVGFLLSAAYWVPFAFEFLPENAERVDQDYEWTLTYSGRLLGTIENFFQPLHTATSTSFGGSSLWVVAALLPLLAAFRVRIPGPVWALWAVALLVFLHALGDRTPVHYLFWKYFPLASSVRGPGRVTFLIPVLLLLVLVWLVRADPVRLRLGGRARRVEPLCVASALALAAMLVYRLLPVDWSADLASNAPARFNAIPARLHSLVFSGGSVALAALFVMGATRAGAGGDPEPPDGRARSRLHRAAGILLFMAVTIQVWSCLRFGTWVTSKVDTPSFAQMQSEKREDLGFRPDPGRGLTSAVVQQQLRRSCLEPHLGRLYREHVVAADNELAYAIMKRHRTPDVVIVEGEVPDAPPPAGPPADPREEGVELIYGSFNRLVFDVRASRASFFGFGHPYSPRWRATVNGEDSEVRRANGAAHAVRVPEGRSEVEFRYRSPASFWGMLLSCATLAAAGAWISWKCAAGRARGASAVAVVLVAAACFVTWRLGLYSGDNLETEFSWSPEPPPERPNLAYGRPTRMTSVFRGEQFEDRWGSGRGVDGVRAEGTGFRTGFTKDRRWWVDLGQAHRISEVVLYGGQHAGDQVAIEVSTTGSGWRQVALKRFTGDVLRLRLTKEPEARFVRVQLGGLGDFMLDEVEVYGAR